MIVRSLDTGLGAVENDTWPSTGAIDTESNSLDLAIKQLARDNFDQGMPSWDSTLQNSWNTFVADWNYWLNTGYFWNPTRRDELLEYRKRFNDLRTQMQAGGVSTYTPEQVSTKGANAFDVAGSLLTKTLWVVGGVAVLLVGHAAYKEFRR